MAFAVFAVRAASSCSARLHPLLPSRPLREYEPSPFARIRSASISSTTSDMPPSSEELFRAPSIRVEAPKHLATSFQSLPGSKEPVHVLPLATKCFGKLVDSHSTLSPAPKDEVETSIVRHHSHRKKRKSNSISRPSSEELYRSISSISRILASPVRRPDSVSKLRKALRFSRDSSQDFRRVLLSSRLGLPRICCQLSSARATRIPNPIYGSTTNSPSRVSPPTTFPDKDSDQHRAYLTRLCNAFRLSQPLDALLHLRPFGLVSCRIRPWG
jgi:hypothetical protein